MACGRFHVGCSASGCGADSASSRAVQSGVYCTLSRFCSARSSLNSSCSMRQTGSFGAARPFIIGKATPKHVVSSVESNHASFDAQTSDFTGDCHARDGDASRNNVPWTDHSALEPALLRHVLLVDRHEFRGHCRLRLRLSLLGHDVGGTGLACLEPGVSRPPSFLQPVQLLPLHGPGGDERSSGGRKGPSSGVVGFHVCHWTAG
ncbi:protein of unknown function [Rhodovastum atsumiense]|nr:protein of unknown function [Rhodovastum atsumiense]